MTYATTRARSGLTGEVLFDVRRGTWRDAQSPAILQAALEAITREEPILRAKGFAMTADGDAITVQAVRHRVTLTTAARAKPLPYAELVVIG